MINSGLILKKERETLENKTAERWWRQKRANKLEESRVPGTQLITDIPQNIRSLKK